MTEPGTAWEDGPGEPGSAPLRFEQPTQPLPYNPVPGFGTPPGQDGYPGQPGLPNAPRRRWRVLRRLTGTAVVLSVLAAGAFGVLFLLTPSVSNAPTLARAFDQAHHAPYPGPPVPTLFAEALVATEDHRFYSEPGVDVFAVARVIKAAITHGADPGGATLYQQLAKMLYQPGGGVRGETEQVMLGVKLDLAYSKAQLLRMYSDVAYFGHGYYGLARASCGYFGTTPAGLTLPEAATLAGLVQAPSLDDPITHHAQGRAREEHVLFRLVATGKVSEAQAAAALGRPLHLVGGPGTGCGAG